jgi:hypothetical protein
MSDAERLKEMISDFERTLGRPLTAEERAELEREMLEVERRLAKAPVVFALCCCAGLFLWVAFPWLKGSREPWNVEDPVYWIYLAVVGVVAGALAPRRFLASYIGVYVGQVIGSAIALPPDPLAAVGWFGALPLSSLATLAGFGIGAASRYVYRVAAAYLRDE